MLNAELTKKCKQFILAHWGRDGLTQIADRPVTWVRHEANPHLQHLRRKQKALPLIKIHSEVNRIHLALSTEHKGAPHA